MWPDCACSSRPTRLSRSRRCAFSDCSARSTPWHHATCNMHHATCNMHHATCNMHHATCNMQRATCIMQRATCNVQHATTCNTKQGQHRAKSCESTVSAQYNTIGVGWSNLIRMKPTRTRGWGWGAGTRARTRWRIQICSAVHPKTNAHIHGVLGGRLTPMMGYAVLRCKIPPGTSCLLLASSRSSYRYQWPAGSFWQLCCKSRTLLRHGSRANGSGNSMQRITMRCAIPVVNGICVSRF